MTGKEDPYSKERWADRAMSAAEPLAGNVEPQATIIAMTPNPLRVMAAAAETYKGNIVRNPMEISRETALAWLADMQKTQLQAPMEFVDIHFLLEGVTRAFTHQLVRQRTAVYVQESQRFIVKMEAGREVAIPPAISVLPANDDRRILWEEAIRDISATYNSLVKTGIPAEDARSILPTNITTRIHYKTNLRNLAQHSGLRLCSQAQYEWKQVWRVMLEAIHNYPYSSARATYLADAWQYDAIASLFKPVCYQIGRCGFRTETDRYCVIRERVEAHYAKGEGPEQWVDIDPVEPLLEGAGRIAP